ncbi:hypothetical protein C1H46_036227 [Malus baccata]|uniref:DDX21/DDX50 dimerisation domain-containing protein n=1 Tax=Malus baccata TaxID=106549 RepID=A0A540KVJ7_MALBA|nr:hypothetical protein C1H46_036227 [Malus baccata]
MITKISDSVIPAFKSVAEELLNTSGLSAVDLLAKALAKAAGYTEIKKRSLLSSMGWKAHLFTVHLLIMGTVSIVCLRSHHELVSDWSCLTLNFNQPCLSFAFGVLRRFLPKEKVDSVKGMALTADGNGQENAANVSITVLKSLPDLQERESRKTRFGGSGRFGGGRGGGFPNDRYSNNQSGGGGRGRSNRW